MKNFIRVFALVAAGLGWGARAEDAGVRNDQVWVDEANQTVYWSPRNELRVSVYGLNVDDNVDAQIMVENKISTGDADAQAQGLREKYPGYALNRVVVSAAGSEWSLKIPSAGLDLKLIPKMGANSVPYVSYQGLLSKTQTRNLVAALKADAQSAVQLNVSVSYSVPRNEVVERVEAGAELCDVLTSKGTTVYELAQGYYELGQRVDQLAKTPGNRDRLRKLVLRSCLSLEKPERIERLSDLLTLRLRGVVPASPKFVAEERKQSVVSENAQLAYSVSADVSGVTEQAGGRR